MHGNLRMEPSLDGHLMQARMIGCSPRPGLILGRRVGGSHHLVTLRPRDGQVTDHLLECFELLQGPSVIHQLFGGVDNVTE